MKTKGSTAWVFTTMVAVVLFMAASEEKGTGESSGNRATR